MTKGEQKWPAIAAAILRMKNDSIHEVNHIHVINADADSMDTNENIHFCKGHCMCSNIWWVVELK